MEDLRTLCDKTIVVTGAGMDPSSEVVGFGYEIARDLCVHGANVAFLGRNTEKLRAAIQKILADEIPASGQELRDYECDVSQEGIVSDVMGQIHEDFGPIYGLVNNAAINLSRTSLIDTDEALMREMLDTNLYGAMYTSREMMKYLPRFSDADEDLGSIVNISSVGAEKVPFQSNMPYCVSKYALEGLTQSIALDHGGLVRANIVRPGYARTPLTKEFFDKNPERLKRIERRQLLGGLVSPKDVARAVTRLMDPSTKLNGEVVTVSNGYNAKI